MEVTEQKVHTCFRSIANVKPNVAPQCAAFTNFEDLGGRSSRYFLSFSISPSSVHDDDDVVVFLYLFNCALFLQCSHVTSMQSPYVLNSNVVESTTGESHASLSVKQLNKDFAKMTLQ